MMSLDLYYFRSSLDRVVACGSGDGQDAFCNRNKAYLALLLSVATMVLFRRLQTVHRRIRHAVCLSVCLYLLPADKWEEKLKSTSRARHGHKSLPSQALDSYKNPSTRKGLQVIDK